VNFALIDQNPI